MQTAMRSSHRMHAARPGQARPRHAATSASACMTALVATTTTTHTRSVTPSWAARCPHLPTLPHTSVLHTSPTPRRRASVSCASLTIDGTPASAIPDQRLSVKLGLAASTGKLDLTDFRLETLPDELFELTELEDLSLAGNCLTHLPEKIGRLTCLKRLQLAGNLLTQLPASIGNLQSLEGMWLGGNLLTVLPPEIGHLSSLKQLSVSGNRLHELPDMIGGLTNLVELEAAGNMLEAVPPSLGQLGALRKLSLNGNRLSALPDTLSGLVSLQEMWLMGNRLTELPPSLCTLPALRQLSVADNALHTLPPHLGMLPCLEKLWAYGNALRGPTSISCFDAAMQGSTWWPALDGIWLEGNPLGPEAATKLLLLAAASPAPALPRLRALGLDLTQLAGVEPSTLSAAGSRLKLGEVLGEGPGYFKLAPSPNLLPAIAAPATSASGRAGNFGYVPSAASHRAPGKGQQQQQGAEGAGAAASEEDERAAGEAAVAAVAAGRIAQQPVLVVSFGSAPGVPNWGGLLGRLYKSSRSRPEDVGFDVLYVVDPARSWYDGGDDAGRERYASRLEQYTRRYEHVVMLGDSMGATAALLFSRLATSVLAFCPQVDLSTASIRPGQSSAWLDTLRDRVVAAVDTTDAEVTALVGTWQHDLDQTKLLPPTKAKVKVFSLDSHRLALYLDQRDKLLPIVQDAIQHEMDVRTGNVRIANLF